MRNLQMWISEDEATTWEINNHQHRNKIQQRRPHRPRTRKSENDSEEKTKIQTVKKPVI